MRQRLLTGMERGERDGGGGGGGGAVGTESSSSVCHAVASRLRARQGQRSCRRWPCNSGPGEGRGACPQCAAAGAQPSGGRRSSGARSNTGDAKRGTAVGGGRCESGAEPQGRTRGTGPRQVARPAAESVSAARNRRPAPPRAARVLRAISRAGGSERGPAGPQRRGAGAAGWRHSAQSMGAARRSSRGSAARRA